MTEEQPGRETDTTQAELKALTVVVGALKSLRESAWQRVISSALTLLGSTDIPPSAEHSPRSGGAPVDADPVDRGPKRGAHAREARDIRTLAETKAPRSDVERAALVAYYLSEIVSASEKKESIDSSEIVRFFKQAKFNVPRDANQTLINAKNAGYLDAMGGGSYALNAVGYNLIAHGLPRDGSAGRAKSVAKRPTKTNKQTKTRLKRSATNKPKSKARR